jgi:hypothetical protein
MDINATIQTIYSNSITDFDTISTHKQLEDENLTAVVLWFA